MPRTDGGNGRPARYYPINARQMAATCRQLAADLRAEHAEGWGMVSLGKDDDGIVVGITRAEAADSLDAQGDRWQHEADTGEKNMVDRARIRM